MTVRSFDIEYRGSLYDPASDATVSMIEEALATCASGDVIVLRARGGCHDYHRSWLSAISTGIFWEDLAAHFQRLHLALIGICVSKAKWYFISGDDCLGSWWDLALACHGRIWANPYAKVGYPEIYIDLIPPLSSGGLRKFSAYQTTEDARKNAIFHAKDAYANGLISLVLQGQGWSEPGSLEPLIAWIRKTPVPSNLRVTTRKELIECTPDLLGVVESRANLQQRRKQLAASHLETGAQLLKEKNIAARAGYMASVRAGGAARMLFEDYRAWLSRRIARYELGARDRWWSGSEGLLVVDLSPGIPPQSIFQAILSRKIHVVLMAPDEGLLKDSVETILSRFQRGGLSRKDVLAMWRGRVDWVVGDASKTPGMWLRCPPTDLVEIGVGGAMVVSAYRLSGNFGQAGLGWVEVLFERDPAEIAGHSRESAARDILDMISNGALITPASAEGLPVGVIARFLLLSEMCRIAATGAWPDVVEQCKLLAASGWGFASDIPQWDALLRGFGKHPALSRFAEASGIDFTAMVNASGISEIRAQTLRGASVARLEVSGARLSRHYEAFAIEVSRRLISSDLLSDPTAADLIVTLAWGYPGASPLPSDLMAQLGPSRVAEWLKT